jgi:hypothetical protein
VVPEVNRMSAGSPDCGGGPSGCSIDEDSRARSNGRHGACCNWIAGDENNLGLGEGEEFRDLFRGECGIEAGRGRAEAKDREQVGEEIRAAPRARWRRARRARCRAAIGARRGGRSRWKAPPRPSAGWIRSPRCRRGAKGKRACRQYRRWGAALVAADRAERNPGTRLRADLRRSMRPTM